MRTIDAALTAEQIKLRLRPAVLAYVGANSYEASRIAWADEWAGSVAAQEYDMCIAGDGSAVVARVDAAGSTCDILRVADPTDSASWAAASWVNVGSADTGSLPSVWADPQAGANVYVSWTVYSSRRVKFSSSADYGATWAANSTIHAYAAGTAIKGIAGAMRTSGARDIYIFVSKVAGGTYTWDYFNLPAGGSWAGPTAIAAGWPAVYALQGMDCVWEDDFLLAIAGQTTATGNGARLWWAVFGDGGTYVAGTVASGVIEQTDVANFLYYTPRLTAGDHIRLWYLDVYTGTGAFRRENMLSLVGAGGVFNLNYWRGPDPIEWEPAGNYGLAVAEWQAALTVTLYALRPGGKALSGTLSAYDDLSARVIGYEFREDPDDQLLVVDFENQDGVLDDCGTAGATYSQLKAGAMLSLSHGVSVGVTAYTDTLAWYRIRRLYREHDGRGRSWVSAECEGYWRILASWEAERVYQWAAAAATLEAITYKIVARVGLTYGSVGALGSALYTTLQPAVIIQPGTSGKAALQRLVALGPDVAQFDLSGAYHRSISRTEAAVYNVGGSGQHPIIRAHLLEGGIAANAFEVYGLTTGVLGASMEYDDIATGGARRQKVVDGTYTAAADAATRAGGEKEKAVQAAAGGWIDCFPIHGLEMWDVLSVTYALMGISGRKYRVCAIREVLDRRRGRYLQRIGLAAME